MFKALKYSALIFMILLSATQTSFATTIPVTFLDSDVTPTELLDGSWTWTHILNDTEFSPNLATGDPINVTDALLTIQMDIRRFNPHDPGGIKLFTINGSGDSFLLDTYVNNDHPLADNVEWIIDLGGLTNSADVLTALNDKSFAVTLSLVADHGTITNVDSSTLSGEGTAIVTSDDPPAPPDPIPTSVPEPSTFLLLGAGLAGVGLVRKGIKK